MNVSIVSESQQVLGGGFSFARNIDKGLENANVNIVSNWQEADIVLIPSTSMITKELFRLIKDAGKKVVVRVDNVPRNSRNRNTGTSRLKLMTQEADEIVYQSTWAKEYLGKFIGREGVLIHNSVDEEFYHPPKGIPGMFTSQDRSAPVYLYSRYSRDETKCWEKAWYEFQMIARETPDAKLIIVGQFSDEQRECNFDFFMGEKIEYRGVIEDTYRMSQMYMQADYLIATYYNDCFSNTYIEFLMTKNPVKAEDVLYKPDLSGGTKEMIQLYNSKGREYFYLNRMAEDYINLFKKILK